MFLLLASAYVVGIDGAIAFNFSPLGVMPAKSPLFLTLKTIMTPALSFSFSVPTALVTLRLFLFLLFFCCLRRNLHIRLHPRPRNRLHMVVLCRDGFPPFHCFRTCRCCCCDWYIFMFPWRCFVLMSPRPFCPFCKLAPCRARPAFPPRRFSLSLLSRLKSSRPLPLPLPSFWPQVRPLLRCVSQMDVCLRRLRCYSNLFPNAAIVVVFFYVSTFLRVHFARHHVPAWRLG